VKRRAQRVRTLNAWRGRVSELLEDVDRMVQKDEGRDPGGRARPKETTIRCLEYTPPVK
jgi:hypothetical protein